MSLRGAREKARARQEPAPKGSLGKLRARRESNGEDKPNALAALKARKQPKKRSLAALRERKNFVKSPLDFVIDGLRYHTVKVIDEEKPWGTVYVSTGDTHVKFHNRYSSWMTDVPNQPGHMREPRTIDIRRNLLERWNREIKSLGILTTAEKRAKAEAEAAEAEKKVRAAKQRMKKMAAARAKAKAKAGT